MRPVANPPNPWASTRVEWLDEEPPPDARLEVFEEEAGSVLSENDSPDVGFRWSVNPYRGCFHACAYCLEGDTGVLLWDGSTRALAEIRPGDEVVGTRARGRERRYVRSRVLAQWGVEERPAWRVSLAGGATLLAGAGHRFLARDGWREVAPSEAGAVRLERGARLAGPGALDATRGFAAVSPRDVPRGSRRLRVARTRPASWVASGTATLDPASRRAERAVAFPPDLRVSAIESAGRSSNLFDMTTTTRDFVAGGVVNHNCYARPSHQYLGFGAGTDFDRKIVVKTNAPASLRTEFRHPSWNGERVVFSGNTDCYQPLEAHYRLTRGCLETCLEFRNPVSLITKGTLVRRDVDVLSALAREARASVAISIPFADEAVARKIEPYVGSPRKRFETMRTLSDAGVRTAIAIAPVIPGLSDTGIPDLLARARDAGAKSAFLVMLRLPGEVKDVFRARLEEAFPDRAKKVWSQIRDVRGGREYDSRFGERGRGRGPRWEVIEALFRTHCARLGFDDDDGDGDDRPSTFRRPGEESQGTLFAT